MNERPWQSNLWQTVDTIPIPKAYEVIPAYLLLEHDQVARGIIFQASFNDCSGVHFGTIDQEILHGVKKWQPVLGLGAKANKPWCHHEDLYQDLEDNSGWFSMNEATDTFASVWILTTRGQVECAWPFRDKHNRLFWGTMPENLLQAVAWKPWDNKIPSRPNRKTGKWPGEAGRPAEHEHTLKDWFKGSDSESDEPVTVVINADRDLHLRLPNGPWRHNSYLPQRLEEGDEDLHGELVWVLQLDGSIVQAKATRDPSGKLRWIAEGPENHAVAWRPYVSGDLNLELPLLYHGATNSPVSWKTLLEWGELKGPGAEKSDRLHWLADLLHDVIPDLAAVFRKKDDKEPERSLSQPLTIPQFTHDIPLRPTAEDVNRHLHEELKEIGELVEAAKAAEPEPVEMDPVDNRDWTQGMYKTANDYDVPPIPGYDEFSREHHEGVVRSVLRDLIREKTRDQTLDEYMANFTPMEFYILQGLATGQEHFVDTKGLAAFNYDRLYRSGFVTRVPVTFGPRLDRNTRQGMGGGGSGTGNVPSRAYASGGGCGYEVWVLTPLGQQFMAYLLARNNRRYVAKNRSDQSK